MQLLLPYVPYMFIQLVQQLHSIILAPKSSTFTFRDDQEWKVAQNLENMMVFICRWMHSGNKVRLGLQQYKLYEVLGDHALKLLINTTE